MSEAIETRAAALGAERTEEYRRLLTDMWRREVRSLSGPSAPLRPNHEGWQDLARRLLDAAGQVSRTTAAK